ncbi:MAG: deoxyribonuclease IV [Patescibacteria group bacterium]|nr:deoxyribonuclease IV [Patescibacteria group bacterium]
MDDNKYPKIGGHVSSAGGLKNGVLNALSIGAECMQMFGSSPRQYRVRMPSAEEIKEYNILQKKYGITPVYLHAPYLVNLASADADIHAKSVEALVGHLDIAESIKANGLIFHIGSHKNENRKEAAVRVIEGMKQVLKKSSGSTQLIMENSATHAKLGVDVKEIAEIFKKVNSSRVKICIDTAHAYASGMMEFTKDGIGMWCDTVDSILGLDNVVVFHINDSKAAFNSYIDRHENIGQGYIGKKGMQALANEKRLWNKAWILEVPGFKNTGPDKKNVDILKSYFT